jgi:hypothetical protein
MHARVKEGKRGAYSVTK